MPHFSIAHLFSQRELSRINPRINLDLWSNMPKLASLIVRRMVTFCFGVYFCFGDYKLVLLVLLLETLSRVKSCVNICYHVIVKCSFIFVQLSFEVICSLLQVCDKSYHYSLDTYDRGVGAKSTLTWPTWYPDKFPLH